ncbi:MAG TPA: trypsin-like peptidase domain-containing protein [Nevskia sp.]|jgi:S1-C subfamily serine protease|nr:trypsin-like peptidase domain-containing protein [Nevskia sp.]
MRHLLAALGCALLSVGCSATDAIPIVPAREALSVPEGAGSKPLLLTRIVVKLRRGEEIGKQMGGWPCKLRGHLTWHGGHADIENEEFVQAFHDALTQANYAVVGDPAALFEDPSASRAELKIAGLVDKLHVDVCYPHDGSHDYDTAKGGAYLRVNWQIYDVIQKKVVYEATTDGAYREDSSGAGGTVAYTINAFDEAVRNLLADPGFHELVTHPRTSPAVAAKRETIRLRGATTPANGVADARAAVVTVLLADGHGSGFIISPDGYVLTNHHVVEQARFVKVRLSSHREVVGEVLRTDSARDVALIKLAESNLPALPLRLATAPDVTEEVYAIGTPIDPGLDTTVTRGIVSAYRNLEGFKFIQSDVVIHPGNSGGPLLDRSGTVVGLTDLKMFPAEADNLNYFIPIGDALQRLDLEVEQAQTASGRME